MQINVGKFTMFSRKTLNRMGDCSNGDENSCPSSKQSTPDIRLEYWDINELSPLSTPAVSRSPSPFDLRDISNTVNISRFEIPHHHLFLTLVDDQVPLAPDVSLPAAPQLPSADPAKGAQPLPQQGQELQQGAQTGQELPQPEGKVIL